jgi:EAL and modified HD-GYP domain-containing signal transduction protein
MYSYVARQAIFDINMQVHAYELLFRNGKKNSFPADTRPEQATSKIITQNHLTSGLEEITGDKLAYINFCEDGLINRFPSSLDPQKIVVEILETVSMSKELLTVCRQLKKQGYKLALDDHDFDNKWDILMPYIDILKIDVQHFNILQLSKYVRRIAGSGITLLAEKVETKDEFEKLKLLGFQLFQGYYFAKPEVLQKKALPSNKLNLLELITESNKTQLNLDKISQIVERDVSLSFKLLRFINSPMFYLKEKIGSLKHAIAYMGEPELKKFISLVALANLNDEKPSELLSLSISRARFCELIAKHNNDVQNPPTAFLTGMFSLVDAMLDEEMQSVLEKLPLLDQIKQALIAEQGDLGMYIGLVRHYEKANWSQAESIANKINLSAETMQAYYSDALNWADNLLAQHQ